MYVSNGFTRKISIETIAESKLHPKLQANEIKLTPVVHVLPEEIAKPAIVELIKTLEPSLQNPNHKLVPLYSLSHPFEWKKLASHGCEMLQDRVVFNTTHFGYYTVIAQFSLPTSSVIIDPKATQPVQLLLQELPGFKMEIPSTSVRSKTEITATIHYDDQSLYGSPASACVVLEPHSTHFEDRIMITIPIPNYDQITRSNPNIKLELWYTDNTKKTAPVRLTIAEESSIIIHKDDSGNCLATAYITHFSGFLYGWSAKIVDYCLNLLVQSIHGRCQVFMSHETKHGSCITFGIAVLLYPFKDPYSSLPNYPYLLYDSVIPVTLVAGDLECQIELDRLLLQSYPSSDDQQCYTKSARFPKDFHMRVEFGIRLDSTTHTELPSGNLATLIIKHSSGECDISPCMLMKVNGIANI